MIFFNINKLNQSDINIFASYPHTYSNGIGISTTVVRNGQAYAKIGKNNYYNSSYQYLMYLNQTVTLSPVIF